MFTAAQDLVFEGYSDKAAALARCCAELKPRDAQVRSFLSSLFLGSNAFADGECASRGNAPSLNYAHLICVPSWSTGRWGAALANATSWAAAVTVPSEALVDSLSVAAYLAGDPAGVRQALSLAVRNRMPGATTRGALCWFRSHPCASP